MTTQAPARATDRPIPSPSTGTGKLWRAAFLSHILNPWNMASALPLSVFMYAMFGIADTACTAQTGRGNLATTAITMMTMCSVILVGDSLGVVLSAERTTGISCMYALTSIQPWVILLVHLTAPVAPNASITLIIFSFGLTTDAQMTPGAWAASAAVTIALSALSTLIGLACGYAIKGEDVYSASVFVMLMGASVSSMPIPLSQLPSFIAQIALFTPLYGVVQAVYAATGTVTMLTTAWLNIAGWAVIMVGIA